MNVNCIRININDNVVTLIKNIVVGDKLLGANVPGGIISLNDLQLGHKIAIQTIKTGEKVIKYGEIIGYASIDIIAGEHVHTHNVLSGRGRGDLE
ncbi:MAG: UxaA family hydrolase [Sphaerochaetaceae bacterium]|nr:UxaA family hydrolase [Sphaerochaetaceae bacterium]